MFDLVVAQGGESKAAVQEIDCEAELILATLMESQQAEPLSQQPQAGPLLGAAPGSAVPGDTPFGTRGDAHKCVLHCHQPRCHTCPISNKSAPATRLHHDNQGEGGSDPGQAIAKTLDVEVHDYCCVGLARMCNRRCWSTSCRHHTRTQDTQQDAYTVHP